MELDKITDIKIGNTMIINTRTHNVCRFAHISDVMVNTDHVNEGKLIVRFAGSSREVAIGTFNHDDAKILFRQLIKEIQSTDHAMLAELRLTNVKLSDIQQNLDHRSAD